MGIARARERGQAAVEFGIIGSALMLLTVGVVDVGRAFYQFNEVNALARYGSRWASVVGGTCALPDASSTSDWCNQLGARGTANFWSQSGNANGCYTISPTYSHTTTIVGAIADRWDTNKDSTSISRGGTSPGLDMSKVSVCVTNSSSPSEPAPGDTVTVTVSYTFVAASGLFGKKLTIPLSASSNYKVE